MIVSCVWPLGSLKAVESAISRLRAAEDGSSEKSRSQPESKLPRFGPEEGCGKKRLHGLCTNIFALFDDGSCLFSRHLESEIPGIAFANSYLNSKATAGTVNRIPVGDRPCVQRE
jgi:hypothetical protein